MLNLFNSVIGSHSSFFLNLTFGSSQGTIPIEIEAKEDEDARVVSVH